MSRKRKADAGEDLVPAASVSADKSTPKQRVRAAIARDTEKIKAENAALRSELLELVIAINDLPSSEIPAHRTYKKILQDKYDRLRSDASDEVEKFKSEEDNAFERVEKKFNGYLNGEKLKLLRVYNQLITPNFTPTKRRKVDPGVLPEIKAFNDAPFDLDALKRLDTEVAVNFGAIPPAVMQGLFCLPASVPASIEDTYDAVFGPYGLFGP
ncbi:MAG: hypothetical protein P1U40_14090 [Coxiellaceae bacterium]|nr:hypothetical protein [Coxiellaceae bacterium]